MADKCVKGQKQTTTPTQRALGTNFSLHLRETTLASLFINIRSQINNLAFVSKRDLSGVYEGLMILVKSVGGYIWKC